MKTFRAIETLRGVRVGALAITVVAALGLSPILIGGNLGLDTASAHPGGGGGGVVLAAEAVVLAAVAEAVAMGRAVEAPAAAMAMPLWELA